MKFHKGTYITVCLYSFYVCKMNLHSCYISLNQLQTFWCILNLFTLLEFVTAIIAHAFYTITFRQISHFISRTYIHTKDINNHKL